MAEGFLESFNSIIDKVSLPNITNNITEDNANVSSNSSNRSNSLDPSTSLNGKSNPSQDPFRTGPNMGNYNGDVEDEVIRYQSAVAIERSFSNTPRSSGSVANYKSDIDIDFNIWNDELESYYTLIKASDEMKKRAKEKIRRQITYQELGYFLTQEFYPIDKILGQQNLLHGVIPEIGSQEDIINLTNKELREGKTEEELKKLNLEGRIFKSISIDRRTKDNGSVFDNYDAGRKLDGLAMGESDVLNPHFQFNELDDLRINPDYPNIGRLYGERIYNFNLPKIQFIAGQLKFKLSIAKMIGSGHNQAHAVSSYLRGNGENKIKWGFLKIKSLFYSMKGFLSGQFGSSADMYEFVPCPKIYMRYVNEILNTLAVYMDLAKSPIESESFNYKELMAEPFSSDAPDSGISDNSDVSESAGDSTKSTLESIMTWLQGFFSHPSEETRNSEIDKADQENSIAVYDGIAGSKHYMGKSNILHVYRILPGTSRRVRKEGASIVANNKSLKDTISDWIFDSSGTFHQMMETQYIPFLLDKGISISETIGNSTSEHPVVGQMNSKAGEAMNADIQKNFDTQMIDSAGDSVKNILSSGFSGEALEKARGDFINGVLGNVGGRISRGIAGHFGGEFGIVMSGQARMGFPEVWQDSSFERSSSISMKLYSPYGNRLSIFENIYVPMIFLLALALPKSIGNNAYMTPFIVRTAAKGLFTCDLGIISSISISRGSEGGDRTVEGFNRKMDISVEVKDLLPKINMSIDGGIWGFLSSKNVGMHGYLRTLANVDVEDMISIYKRIGNLVDFLKGQYSLENLGLNFRTNLAQSKPFQIISFVGKGLGMISDSRVGAIRRFSPIG